MFFQVLGFFSGGMFFFLQTLVTLTGGEMEMLPMKVDCVWCLGDVHASRLRHGGVTKL